MSLIPSGLNERASFASSDEADVLGESRPSISVIGLGPNGVYLGTDVLTDIHALQPPPAPAAVASHPLRGLCLMHMPGAPATTPHGVAYADAAAAPAEKVTTPVEAGTQQVSVSVSIAWTIAE